jgi:16S rRNA U516 pseudouridylate synthase RsuA-like enzyme
MIEAIDNEVVRLERIMIGALKLPETLANGEVRALTAEETAMLFAIPDDL